MKIIRIEIKSLLLITLSLTCVIIISSCATTPQTCAPVDLSHKSIKKLDMEEGCLSVPEVYGMVKRPKTILIRFYDELGQSHIKKYEGLPSVVIQHEYDHNRGILFIDKVSKYTSGYENISDIKE